MAGDGDPGAGAGGRRERAGKAIRGVALDLTPLRVSRDYRRLWFGQLVSHTGSQITVVATFFQVYSITHSSAAVGLVGLIQLVPLIVMSIGGGAFADRLDRRRIVLASEVALASVSGLLLVNALLPRPSLVIVYVAAGLVAGLVGIEFPARAAMTPRLVGEELVPSALALGQLMFNATMLVGPALGGIVIAKLGLEWAYGVDVLSFSAALVAAILLKPMPPERDEADRQLSGLAAVKEGFAFLKGRRVLQSTFVIDLIAMIFGMPRALFPVLALDVFRAGASGVGLLFAAPAAGALLGAAASGWVKRVRHQGRAVIWAVAVWGLAIAAFGAVGAWAPRMFWLALAMLAVAGAADVISAVFRGTILVVSVPDRLRGRLTAINILVVTGGPRLGDFEAGAVAALVSPIFSVVSGGLACVVGVGLMVLFAPKLARYHAGDDELAVA
jgi:MFS family permease